MFRQIPELTQHWLRKVYGGNEPIVTTFIYITDSPKGVTQEKEEGFLCTNYIVAAKLISDSMVCICALNIISR